MQTVPVVVRSLRLAGLVLGGVLVAACGSSNGDSSGQGPGAFRFRVAALPFTLAGNEAALDLSDPDAVLSAALTALSIATAASVGDIGDIDDGFPAPGRGLFFCDAGNISEAVTTSTAGGGVRTVTFTAQQCYQGQDDSVQDGILELAYSQPSASQAQGDLSFGFGTGSLTVGIGDDADEADFIQLKGRASFDGDLDGSPTRSTLSGFQYIIGRGARPDAGATLSVDRQIEILAGGGSSAVDFSIEASESGSSRSLEVSGPISIAGSGTGLDAACRFSARFSVVTNTPVTADDFDDGSDELPRGGMLTLSTDTGSATVQFDSSGNALVDTPAGAPVTFTAEQVRTFCGL